MGTKIKISIVIFSTFLFASCAFHKGEYFNSVQLNTNNFKYVKINATGEATASYFLGLGGVSTSAIIGEAKENLNNKYGLKANQTLANVSINWKTTIVFFFTQVKCTVSGDLIEFTNNGIGNQSSNAMSSQESIGITTIIKPSSEEIAKQKSDSIMNKQSVDKMKKIADANIVKQSKKDSIERHSKLPAYEKFKTLYKVGDQFNFVDPTTENMINGIITEINLDNIVIEYGTQKRKKQLKIKDIQI